MPTVELIMNVIGNAKQALADINTSLSSVTKNSSDVTVSSYSISAQM
jgi:hypothetical protein